MMYNSFVRIFPRSYTIQTRQLICAVVGVNAARYMKAVALRPAGQSAASRLPSLLAGTLTRKCTISSRLCYRVTLLITVSNHLNDALVQVDPNCRNCPRGVAGMAWSLPCAICLADRLALCKLQIAYFGGATRIALVEFVAATFSEANRRK